MNTTDAKKIVTGSKKKNLVFGACCCGFCKVVFTVEPSDESFANIARWLLVYCVEFLKCKLVFGCEFFEK